MVKFSDISKLWKDPDEQPQKEGQPKKFIPAKNEVTQPGQPGGVDEGVVDRPGQLKTPKVPQARLIDIKNIPEKEVLEKVKYSAGPIKPPSDIIGTPQARPVAFASGPGMPAERKDEISFRPLRAVGSHRNIVPGRSESAPEDAKLNISEVANQDDNILQAASVLYDKLYSANQNVIGLINANTSNRIDIHELTQLVKETISFMGQSHSVLIGLAYRDPRQDYFISHQINVVLFSLSIASGFGYSQNQLEELGLTAFLHDVSMQELPGVADRPEQKHGALGKDVIKNYIKSGLQILRQIPFLPAVILDVCRQYHENYHGEIAGLVHEYAQIMRMADNFETLTHYRPNRVTKTAQAALRELIETADTDFARKALKILIKQIGIYPVGTFVLLNTQEIAEVVRSNENFPLRPVINVLQVAEGKLSHLRTVDLLANHSLYVTGTLTREDALAKARPEQGT